LRLQQAGYIHSTVIDGDTAYRNVTVELLLPQQEGRNICASVMSIQPLNCPSAHADSAALLEQPQFETNQTKINLIRLKPRQSFTLETSPRNRLVVVLDEAAVLSGANNPSKTLHSGDILWRDSNSPAQLFENAGNKEIRLVTFAFTNDNSAK
jgi:quercetin dioxygenase-like cupin family protein